MKSIDFEKIDKKMNELLFIAKALAKFRAEKEKEDLFFQATEVKKTFNNAVKRNHSNGFRSIAKKIDDLGRKFESLKKDEKYWKK